MPSTPRRAASSLSSSSSLSAEKLSLPSLQSKMKSDPEGYESELSLIYNQFNSSLDLFQQQAALNFTSISGIAADPAVAKDLGDRVTFLAHVTPFYPKQLAGFPTQLADFLRSAGRTLPSGLRCHVAQALILLINRKIVDIGETLALFMELQTLGDRVLRKLAFSHVIHSIRRMNQKHKNDANNRALQNILFVMLQQEDEAKAKQSLITLCDLHRRKVWFDDRTANAICTACFHPSSRIMISALSFLLDYENIVEDEDSDGSSSEDDLATQQPHVLLNRESIYKAHHKGTTSSKKKKKAKLQRAIRSMKKQQRVSSEKSNPNYYSPLNHLKDAQGFAEKLFSRLQTCNERFEVVSGLTLRSCFSSSFELCFFFFCSSLQVKMMMLKVIARTVGLHRLILLNFYPFLQKYVQPHQRDVTSLLAAAVQACHDMVPPDAVEPLFKQVVNQFVHDRSRTEAIAVGLNVVREICLRMPLLMTEDLLQDLVLYKKSHEKAVASAARSLVTLFREVLMTCNLPCSICACVCPSLLIKKDRGRPTDPKAKPKAFGETNVASNVPGLELLEHDGEDDDNDDEAGGSDDGEDSNEHGLGSSSEDDKELSAVKEDVGGGTDEDDVVRYALDVETEDENDDVSEDEDGGDDDGISIKNDSDMSDEEDVDADSGSDDDDEMDEEDEHEGSKGLHKLSDNESGEKKYKAQKRKYSDIDQQLNAADTSLRALKRLAAGKKELELAGTTDDILSNEDFQRIKELKAKKEARTALTQHGLLKKGIDAKSTAFKVPSSDQLSAKRVDPSILEAFVKKKMSKEEKLALVRAGREERGKYQARAAIKQKKVHHLF
ncbi:hypothetical protein C3L33_13423, partial [Rhododendron williamsianum]